MVSLPIFFFIDYIIDFNNKENSETIILYKHLYRTVMPSINRS